MTSETQMRYGSRVRRQGRSRRWRSNQESRSRRRKAWDGVTVTNYTLYRPNWQGRARGPGPGTGVSAYSCMASFTFLQFRKVPLAFPPGAPEGGDPVQLVGRLWLYPCRWRGFWLGSSGVEASFDLDRWWCCVWLVEAPPRSFLVLPRITCNRRACIPGPWRPGLPGQPPRPGTTSRPDLPPSRRDAGTMPYSRESRVGTAGPRGGGPSPRPRFGR